jgi:hypothetical protein
VLCQGRQKKSKVPPISSGYQPPASQQYFSLIANQPPPTSQQYFSLTANQQQPSATCQTNRPMAWNNPQPADAPGTDHGRLRDLGYKQELERSRTPPSLSFSPVVSLTISSSASPSPRRRFAGCPVFAGVKLVLFDLAIVAFDDACAFVPHVGKSHLPMPLG